MLLLLFLISYCCYFAVVQFDVAVFVRVYEVVVAVAVFW